MRTKYSSINIIAGIGNQLILALLGFVSRTVFVQTLGAEYLGINGLLTNILGLLALVEAGIGSSIIYSLYKPVAEKDQTKIGQLMQLYKKAYLIIAGVVFLLGLLLLPFLGMFTKDTSVEHIHLIYFIFLINTIAPFLYVHKISFLNVSQKNYIVTGVYSISSILSVCFKIGILYYTQNYVLYLSIDSFLTIIHSVVLAWIVNRMYPFLKNKVTEKLDSATSMQIVSNVKAIVLQNIGVYLIFGTDNILIASFISVTAVGLYSNYSLLIEMARSFINQVFNNVYHSVGNLVAKESKEKIYSIYKAYRFLNFWLYSFCTIVMMILIEPFIRVWLGSSYLLSTGTLIVLMLSFYERGMRNSITTLKTTSGIFRADRYSTLIQAVINLAISILLVRSWGITGIFIGTLISALVVPFWYTPYLVYKKLFEKPVWSYFIAYGLYTCVGVGIYWITLYSSEWIVPQVDTYRSLLARLLVCITLPNVLICCIFYRTAEFKTLLGAAKFILQRLWQWSGIRQKQRSSAG